MKSAYPPSDEEEAENADGKMIPKEISKFCDCGFVYEENIESTNVWIHHSKNNGFKNWNTNSNLPRDWKMFMQKLLQWNRRSTCPGK